MPGPYTHLDIGTNFQQQQQQHSSMKLPKLNASSVMSLHRHLGLPTAHRKRLVCVWLTLTSLALCLAVSQAYPTAADLSMFTSMAAGNKLDGSTASQSQATSGIGGDASDIKQTEAAQQSSGAGVNVGSGGNGAIEPSSGFHQFITSSGTPDSTIIGELKPNASALEKMRLRNKIANTILSMQELDRQDQLKRERQRQALASGIVSQELLQQQQQQQQQQQLQQASNTADCYIEVTRIEKVPGKCHRAGSGLPICQSENYMTISNECN